MCRNTFVPTRPNRAYCSRLCKGRANGFKTLYGLGIDDYHRMKDEQAGMCAACERPFDLDNDPVVDHDHATGKVRGFVHRYCNIGLGHAHDDYETLFHWQVHLARHELDLVDMCAR